jgi:hypothetical protein
MHHAHLGLIAHRGREVRPGSIPGDIMKLLADFCFAHLDPLPKKVLRKE